MSSESVRRELNEPYERYRANELRNECHRRGLRPKRSGPYAKYNKSGFISLLRPADALTNAYANSDAGFQPPKHLISNSAPHKTRHCAFRLINIIFSDEFSIRVREIDGNVRREELDESKTNGKNPFWGDIAKAFVTENSVYSELISRDKIFEGINPGIIIPHDSVKLRRIWKDTTSNYQRVVDNMHKSGTHDSEFINFARGKIDLYYLHLWLEKRPNLFAPVKGKIPTVYDTEICLDTSLSINEESDSTSTSIRMSKSKKDQNNAALKTIAESIKIMAQERTIQSLNENLAKTVSMLMKLYDNLGKHDPSSTVYKSIEEDIAFYEKTIFF